MKVKSIKYNWHQVGSVQDRDGIGENWERFTVGEKGVKSIKENEPHNGMQVWNYVVELEDKTKFRIFKPNIVEYFSSQNGL